MCGGDPKSDRGVAGILRREGKKGKILKKDVQR